MLKLTGGQDRLEQTSVRQVPAFALRDCIITIRIATQADPTSKATLIQVRIPRAGALVLPVGCGASRLCCLSNARITKRPEASESPNTAIAAGNPNPASMAANFLGIKEFK